MRSRERKNGSERNQVYPPPQGGEKKAKNTFT